MYMYIKTRTNVYDFHFHLIWVTKYRKKVFNTDSDREDMKNIIRGIAKEIDVEIEKIEVMPDNIHLLISFPPRITPSSVVKSFKGVSARLWFQQHPETRKLLWKGHLWSGSFFMSTLGNMSKEIVEQYINNQINKNPIEQKTSKDSSRH